MKLNKSASYVLIALLRGRTTSAAIADYIPSLGLRTIQRGLERLVGLDLAIESGPSNDPSYAVNYSALLRHDFTEKLLTDEKRPDSIFNYELLEWLESQDEDELVRLFGTLPKLSQSPMTQRELEQLTVELSWKSSSLEGNTYTLFDTQMLLTEGIKAPRHTDFETQMILNHKDAITFILENKDLFSDKIAFSSVEELHRIISKNLGIDSGVRKKIVKISYSNYTPPETPLKIREAADTILGIISKQKNPYIKSLLALSLLPYLQTFEDGNKRTGRMLANAILISTIGQGFSLRKVEARDLALAYLAFYEFASLDGLKAILDNELQPSGSVE